MPGQPYTDIERAFVEAAEDKFTASEVARKLGRPEIAVYRMAREMGVKFRHKPQGSLELGARGAFVIPKGEVPRYQEYVNRIGKRFGLHSKSAVFLKALELASESLG